MDQKKTKYKKLYLRCTFTDKEMADLASVMADKTQELKRIDANAKAAAAQFKSDKESAQNEIDNAARKYRDGYEMRDVECEETLDFESGVVRYWRSDNGDLAQERKMSNEERQMCLEDVEVDPVDEADRMAQEQADAEREAHMADVQRTMAQERSVQM